MVMDLLRGFLCYFVDVVCFIFNPFSFKKKKYGFDYVHFCIDSGFYFLTKDESDFCKKESE